MRTALAALVVAAVCAGVLPTPALAGLNLGLPDLGGSLDLGALVTGRVNGTSNGTTVVVGRTRAEVEGTVSAVDAQAKTVTIAEGSMSVTMLPAGGRVMVNGRATALAEVKPGMRAEARGVIVGLMLEGTVRAKRTSSFVLAMAEGDTTVMASAAAVAQLRTGQRVRVAVTSVGDGMVAAKSVTAAQAAATLTSGSSLAEVGGTVTASTANAIEVRGGDGPMAVQVNGSTTILLDGAAASAADLAAGMTVRAFGQRSGRTLAATLVVATRAAVVLRGTVTALGSGSFTLQTETSGQAQVSTSQATVVADGQVSSASSLKTGDQVEVVGSTNAQGQFVARVIVVQ